MASHLAASCKGSVFGLSTAMAKTAVRSTQLAQMLRQQFNAVDSNCIRMVSCQAQTMAEARTPVGADSHATACREDLSGAGSIELLIGPMFAGKTSALLQRIGSHEAASRRVLTVKSDKDVRYGSANLHTHDGKSKACYAVANLSDLKDNWPEAYRDCQVIAIDEAQFFNDLYQFCCTAANEDQKHIIVAGLDGDFRRQKFGQILDLVPQADIVSKLQSRCKYCEAQGSSRKALFSLRIAADERQEVVGGADIYAPVCRKHYESLSKIRHQEPDDL